MLFVGTSIIHPSTEGVFLLCNILDLLIYSKKNKVREVSLAVGYENVSYFGVVFQKRFGVTPNEYRKMV